MSITRTAKDSESTGALRTDIKIGITGCTGRVGATIVREILSGHWDGVHLAGGTIKPGFPGEGEDLGTHLGQAHIGVIISTDAENLFEKSDVVIDFTAPEATRQHAWLAAKHHTPLIIGTTGLTVEDEKELADAAKETTIVYAANMSVGVNLLLALVEQAASRLGPDWDIEIFESHHKHKVDAPSGTALALGRSAAKGRDMTLEQCRAAPYDGLAGERKRGSIGFSVARGGDVVGEHTVYFYGEGERIELSHRATNRALFAKGALRAALWSVDRNYGLYSMRDVLDL